MTTASFSVANILGKKPTDAKLDELYKLDRQLGTLPLPDNGLGRGILAEWPVDLALVCKVVGSSAQPHCLGGLARLIATTGINRAA
jgi:hypothetical protein